ncbi:ABC transporter substrate-binding protein [Undibacterium sp.]|jgi:branched-chain amino acid transport system substrate-binding protein|uniref:ABC transporter substrate-binding protein n=1 Tax=Undibacterium sp. TaxID=1914977 RepID=UPI002CB9B563|nr:ABC transporter substrate-binding protein [Undibacterium sp.]HTD07051.1 ABC transporter substrate-binding protein [Undibacterium sp.]
MTKLIKYLLSAVFLCTAGYGATFASAAEKNIIVGQAIDLSGQNGSIGRDYATGLATYFDSVNAAGGVNGRRIKYLTRDDRGDAATSAKAVAELIEQDKADYLIGGIGGDAVQAVVASASFARSGQVLFAPLANSSKNYGQRVLFWRPSQEQEIQYIFSYFGKLGIKKVGIAYQETPLNQEAYQYVVAELARRGLSLSGTARIFSLPADTDREAKKLAGATPDIVIAIADTISTGLFLKEFRKHAARTFVAGTSLINLTTLAEMAGPKMLEWTVFSQVVPNPSAAASAIQNDHIRMMKKYRDESVSSLTLEGFVVGKSLVRAMQMSNVANRGGAQNFFAQKSPIDLGGLMINPADPGQHLSGYVDIALFRKGGGLLF